MAHSPRTKGIIQHFEQQMRLQVEGLGDDIRTTNERLGQLESSQLATGATLNEMKTAQATTNTNLANIMTRLQDLSQQLANVVQGQAAHSEIDEQGDADYAGDTEHEELPNNHNARDHHRWRANQQGMRQNQHRREVRNQDDSFAKVKFTIPAFNSKYDPDAYLNWELAIDQKFACHAFPANNQVRAATSEFTDFASIWWREHCGTNSVEEYYQELQIGMLRCGLVENDDAAMARFLGGLNREIQDVLDYKEYNNITRLFHLACKAEREVQGRQTRTRANYSAGRTNSWKPATTAASSSPSAAPSPSSNKQQTVSLAPHVQTKAAHNSSTPSALVASTGCTKEIQCHRCKGYGHVIRDCPNKRVLVIREDGEYSSASDLDDATYAMLATDVAGHKDTFAHEEHVAADDADKYFSLEYSDVFPKDLPAGLPPLRGIEHQIDLIPGASLPNRAPYRTNPDETKEIQRQVQELLDKGYIHESLSPCAVPVLLVPKKDGSWRKFVVVYFDDILIYNNSLEEHIDHLRAVFDALRSACLFENLDKCSFCTAHVSFLGYVVTAQGIEVDSSKIEAIQSWPTPSTVTQIRSFLGLAGFYRRFVRYFSTIAAPLNELTKKGVPFSWGPAQDEAFLTLKDKLTHAPLLQLPDFTKMFELECDA
ncbi:uncharacterized protein LOC133884007 [Phragmites australis]|uniref:uncharacterized protein LOC133884007 n=1 Tax=Phragmites australis TaxID=29695 RepID=UPI002D76DE1B|nr:uncharacterized protein LOC133884007 [Phragmites australis]